MSASNFKPSSGIVFNPVTATAFSPILGGGAVIQQTGVLPGANTDYFSTPDSVANSITGDIDIIARMNPDSWAPVLHKTIVAKWNATSSQRSYAFRMMPTGFLGLMISPNGSTTTINNTSTAKTGELLWPFWPLSE